MEKKRRRGLIQALIMIIMAAAIAVILIYMIPERYHLNDEVVYQVDPSVTDNPLIGFAPPAENGSGGRTGSLRRGSLIRIT